MELFEFETNESFNYENGFYLTSEKNRIGKLLVHYELYKKTVGLPGHVVECGVFKGNSLVRWSTFRDLLENPLSKKIIGFDVFGDFPETNYEADKELREKFVKSSGNPIDVMELEKVFEHKKFNNYELVKGDVLKTIPDYLKKNPQLRISLLHVDIDVYEPAKVILENFWSRIVPGGIMILDDYGVFPGETDAVDDFFKNSDYEIKKIPFGQASPSYIIKHN